MKHTKIKCLSIQRLLGKCIRTDEAGHIWENGWYQKAIKIWEAFMMGLI